MSTWDDTSTMGIGGPQTPGGALVTSKGWKKQWKQHNKELAQDAKFANKINKKLVKGASSYAAKFPSVSAGFIPAGAGSAIAPSGEEAGMPKWILPVVVIGLTVLFLLRKRKAA